MFGINHWEILVVAGIALLLFGPSMLPKLARSVGDTAREFRKSVHEINKSDE